MRPHRTDLHQPAERQDQAHVHCRSQREQRRCHHGVALRAGARAQEGGSELGADGVRRQRERGRVDELQGLEALGGFGASGAAGEGGGGAGARGGAGGGARRGLDAIRVDVVDVAVVRVAGGGVEAGDRVSGRRGRRRATVAAGYGRGNSTVGDAVEEFQVRGLGHRHAFPDRARRFGFHAFPSDRRRVADGCFAHVFLPLALRLVPVAFLLAGRGLGERWWGWRVDYEACRDVGCVDAFEAWFWQRD